MHTRGVKGEKASSSRRNVRWQSGGCTAEEDEERGEGGDLCRRLSAKIRSQAGQLADLTERLQQSEAYSRLVETRLLELDPKHPLPVTPQHVLGNNSTRGRLHRQGRSSPVGVGRRDVHAVERYTPEQEQRGDDMRRGYHAAQERLKEAAQLIRQLREALANRWVQADQCALENAFVGGYFLSCCWHFFKTSPAHRICIYLSVR